MFPWKTVLKHEYNLESPVYLQVSNQIISEIRNGRVKPGFKLPGTRQMAELIKLNRKTITIIYDELEAQGWIKIIPNRGTFVTKSLPEIVPEELGAKTRNNTGLKKAGFKTRSFPYFRDYPTIAKNEFVFDEGFPDVGLAPIKEFASSYRRVLKTKSYKNLLTYSDRKGDHKLRDVLADYLNQTRGMSCTNDNIQITRGSQMGLYLACSIIISPGDNVVVGKTNYATANKTFQNAEANLIKIEVDDSGIVVDEIKDICKSKKITAIFVTPHHHHPTTVTLTAERRLQLLVLAEKYGFAIIEDDYDFDFHYSSSPILPLASVDHSGLVIYIGSFTKTIAPAMRIGYLVGPQDFIELASSFRRIIDMQGDSVLERSLAEMITEGTIQRHLKKALKEYRIRRDLLTDLLANEIKNYISFDVPEGGLATWVKFNHSQDLNTIRQAAFKNGLSIPDGDQYIKNGNYTRLGFASMSPEVLTKAALKLKETLISLT